MKTCLIYGHDGLDLDVTYNLKTCYKDIGFNVFFSKHLHKADLLVITRALDQEFIYSEFDFGLIHIYDYTGWDFDRFVSSIDYSKTFIFCTALQKSEILTKSLGFPSDHIFLALPPVDVKMWSRRLKPIKYNLIHIGNFKSVSEYDIIQELFFQTIKNLKVHIWGSGWKGNKEFYHGKAGLFRVSSIYSETEFSLGLMYPFQRNTTFSGRFWHAPLNGCCLISEPGLYTKKIPGIIETDYSVNDIESIIKIKPDREKIQKEAILFWTEQYRITQNYINSTLGYLKIKRRTDLRFITYFQILSYNIMIECYQKSGISLLLRGVYKYLRLLNTKYLILI